MLEWFSDEDEDWNGDDVDDNDESPSLHVEKHIAEGVDDNDDVGKKSLEEAIRQDYVTDEDGDGYDEDDDDDDDDIDDNGDE